MKLPIFGPGYQGRSPNISVERCVNLYVEKDSDENKQPSLFQTPGLALLANTGYGVHRGDHVFNGVTYFVAGNSLYSMATNGTVTGPLGQNLLTSSGRVSMADNGLAPTGGNQLMIADGTALYCWNVATSTWNQVDRTYSFSSADGVSWSKSSMPWIPDAAYWSSVAWKGTTFCAIAYGTNIAAISTDGSNWQAVTMPSTAVYQLWSSIACNDTTFCAIETVETGDVYSNNIATSPDGVNWTVQQLPVFGVYKTIIASNSLFVVIPKYSTNTFYTSTTGATGSWTARTLPVTDIWGGACWNRNIFCVASTNGTYNALTSSDGITWTKQTLATNFGYWNAMAWNGSLFCLIGYSSDYFQTSPDGINWVAHYSASIVNTQWTGLAWNGELFCAVSNYQEVIATSPDGIDWTLNQFSYSISAITANLSTGHNLFLLMENGAQAGISANSVSFLGGYFLADITGGGNQFQVSNLYDGANWSTLYKSSADAFPDFNLTVFNNQGMLWLLCQNHSEVWYQSGVGNPPFARITGAILDYGCAARFSIAKGENSLFWLATIKNGDTSELWGIAQASSASSPQLVSTPAVTYQISQYSTISDAWGYCFSAEGHDHYRITFPSANGGNGATWDYDITMQSWHEIMTSPFTWQNPGGHIANTYFYFNGKHYVSSTADGSVYEMSNAYLTDNGNAIACTRVLPFLWDADDFKNIFCRQLQLDIQGGYIFPAGYANAFQLSTLGDTSDSTVSMTISGVQVFSYALQEMDTVTANFLPLLFMVALNNGLNNFPTSGYWQAFASRVTDHGSYLTVLLPSGTCTIQKNGSQINAVFMDSNGMTNFVNPTYPQYPNIQAFSEYSPTLPFSIVLGGNYYVGNVSVCDYPHSAVGSFQPPQVTVSWSKDGGHTWSSPKQPSRGCAPRFDSMAIWDRIGMAKNWAFAFNQYSSSVQKVVWTGAAIDAAKGLR